MSQHRIPLKRKILRLLITSATICISQSLFSAEDIRAIWQLEDNQAVVGQGLTLTIQVEGTDSISPPKFSIPGVSVDWLGGQPSNSTSIVSINGKTTTSVRKAFVGKWALKAQNAGHYHLDPLTWTVSGTSVTLNALDWNVTNASTNEKFFVKQTLAQTTSVPGVTIDYTVVWYLGDSARNPDFTLPILDGPDLELAADLNKGATGETFQVNYHNQAITGVKSTANLNGKTWTTLSFKLQIKPKKAGRYDLSGTAVAFEGVAGTRNVQDFFGDIRQESYYKTFLARANPLSLDIRDLPSAGKPAVFSGLIGKLALSWEGAQGPYHVGEPIRLALKLSGVGNKPDLDVDYMVTTSLQNQDFTIVTDLSDTGAVSGTNTNSDTTPALVRHYVIRARNAGTLTIPELLLNYFDPETNTYRIASAARLNLNILGGQGDSSLLSQSSSAAPGSAASTNNAATGAAPINPPGLPGYLAIQLPWWLWAMPGLLAAIVLSALGWWKHSPQRALRRERQSWSRLLRPLDSAAGRATLEEGRLRLLELLEIGPHMRHSLEQSGNWNQVQQESRAWDEAFFDEGRDHEDWHARWNAFAHSAGAWK